MTQKKRSLILRKYKQYLVSRQIVEAAKEKKEREKNP